MKYVVIAMCLAIPLAAVPAVVAEEAQPARFEVEIEAGAVWQARNDVQIPNTDEGTRFSLVDVLGNGPWPAARLYLAWQIAERHGLRALLAPLQITETGVLSETVQFAGGEFEAGVPTDATYRFNSWRLTYQYRFHHGSRWAWWVGFTAKVRDAKIELDQDGESASKTDLGFVPLLNVHGRYRFSETWRIDLDIDALAGGPGRAEDASLKLYADINRNWSVSAGYRTVEGGADVEEVYNFAWFHYAVVSGVYRF